MKIGDKLRALRKNKKLSMRFVARKIRMSVGSIYAWEQNRTLPRPRALERLCSLYKVKKDIFTNHTIPITGIAAATGIFSNAGSDSYFGGLVNIDLKSCEGVVIKGNSMSPYRNGDVVLYNKKMPVESGDMVYIKLKEDKGTFFKLFFRISDTEKNKNVTNGFRRELEKYKSRRQRSIIALFSTTDTHHPLFITEEEIEVKYKVVGVIFGQDRVLAMEAAK